MVTQSWIQRFSLKSYFEIFKTDAADNKAKRKIFKRVFQENKARQIFRKTIISYPLIRRYTCTYQDVTNLRFSENLACFVVFFWNTRFEIRLFALSPTIPGIWGRFVKNHLESDVKNSVKFRKLAPTEGVEEDWMRRLHVRETY